MLNHIVNQTLKCLNVTAAIHSETEFEVIRFCQVKYCTEIIGDRIYSLITTNGRNKSTGFCYHVLFESTVIEPNRILLCSQGSIYSNYDKSKIFNSPNIKHNTIKMPLKVLYTHIHGLLPHQLFRLSIHTTSRLAYKKHETSKRLCSVYSKSREETLSSLS